MEQNYQIKKYLLRRKVFQFFGSSFRISDESGNLCFYVKQKAFKLREDIRIYSDTSMTDELLLIKARKVIDFSSAYDVYDSKANEKIGALKRRGIKSMVKDEWIIFDSVDNEIGRIHEDSTALALIRRLLLSIIPQTFQGFLGNTPVFAFHQQINPFIFKMMLDFQCDTENRLDRRIGISAAVLLGAIEGRQD